MKSDREPARDSLRNRIVGAFFHGGAFLLVFWALWWDPFPEQMQGAFPVAAIVALVFFAVRFLSHVLGRHFNLLFTLRSLLIFVALVLVFSSWLSVKMWEAARQREAVRELRQKGVHATYIWVANQWGNQIRKPEPPCPLFLWNLLGEDLFSGLDFVYFDEDSTDEDLAQLRDLKNVRRVNLQFCFRLTDRGYQYLAGLEELEELRMPYSSFADVSMQHLRGLKKLQDLDLFETTVTDAGLEHFEGMNSLRWIHLTGTNVTPEGVKKLQEALPDCEIVH